MERIELLAPAGDFERLKIALMYGADAVYIGGQDYSLRANATNFSLDEIKEACLFAHNLKKRVYLTVNIVFHEEDLDGVFLYLEQAVAAGIDAFIVSDPFLIRYIHDHFPKVEVHVSTQASTTNEEAVRFYQDEGARRVVLARELSCDEIRTIIEKTQVDTEVFIHGAMCTFYSGRCVLSNYFTNRDSNRGGCSQVCRFAFQFEDQKDHLFTMATKDLNMSHHIKELIAIGVKSLKIEGRMRSHYYLATVLSCYRKLIDAVYDGTLSEELEKKMDFLLGRVANRQTSTHYYFHEADEMDQYYTGRQEISNQDFLGVVLDYDQERKEVLLTQRNYFKVGDEVEIFTPSGQTISFIVSKIYDEEHSLLDCARHPEQKLWLPLDEIVPKDAMMRKKIRMMENGEEKI